MNSKPTVIYGGKIEKGMFGEAYTVNGHVLNQNNGCRMMVSATVIVPVKHGVNEKNNHDKAQQIMIDHLLDMGHSSIGITEVIYQ